MYIYAWACMQYYKINGTKEDYPSTCIGYAAEKENSELYNCGGVWRFGL
jgi:hypothetical protein